MNGLLLHCGAHNISRADLALQPKPEPMGPRHNPTPHIDFLDLVEEKLDKSNLKVTEEAFGLTHDGMRFFALLQLEHTRADYATMLGLRGSHDESFARGVGIGSRMFVCDNLCFSGAHVIKTKNTTNVMKRLPSLIGKALGSLPEEIERQDKLLDNIKGMPINNNHAESIIVEMVRRQIVLPSRIGKVIDVWDHERGALDEEYEPKYLVDGDATGWTLFNSATEVLRPSDNRGNVPIAMDRTLALTNLFEEQFE